ncbi:MAG: transketolase [Gemmatimonadetes bacterium]|uniref:Transketolase n=1 Tax=Candidatus Kutchimonas denitrificans TaxID=3056748 RepID=A0AAE4ZAU4_9BACT|nr:transketolase [Gemmatimonadota bacterium]NIR75822.1 transketolase [Candidatus Kutchimonas denitrificans]NIS01990.1 transketolase [Gemmatimonadota bacterium]NIT67794.1 transketolase [Gemmatimonadota bacterium]NIU53781.1 transketolase [Gemmatimonadota bacterium]
MSGGASDLDQLAINTIRTLSMDAVEKADSGHPGTPMALAPVAYCLWQRFLRFDPNDPLWPGRDRFVLSAGHASMLLYSLLHLAGVKQVDGDGGVTDQLAVTLDEIKNFRQLESRTPGHPEFGLTTGVETTTGPLGQGVSVSVGMAIAGRWLAERFNRKGFDIYDYDVYALASDGDMMEGISSEAASLAGHLKLPNLCWVYDNNHISIDGSTDLAFSESVGDRFRAYGWQVIHVEDANDVAALHSAFAAFRDHSDGPTMIIVDSHIAYGAPTKQDTAEAHGSPLGEEDIRGAKKFYGWPEDKKFWVPDDVREAFASGIAARGGVLRDKWMETFAAYKEKYPELAGEIEMMQRRELPSGWDEGIPTFDPDEKGVATRAAGGKVLTAIAQKVPWLIGGAADLTPSTKTYLEFDGAGGDFGPEDHGARNLRFGVREHSMGAILSGLAHCGLRPYGATFLIFSDYMRPPIRLAALMELPVIYVFTHDSIGLGEDGPTHQPVEQLAALRAIPNLVVIRPCDANETAEAWRVVMQLQNRPAALALSRQKLPTLDRSRYAAADGLRRGAYVLAGPEEPEVVIIASGSEVDPALRAYEELAEEGVKVRVVSMPSRELFEEQDKTYQDSVLPPECQARVIVEAAVGLGWHRYVGAAGAAVVQDTFGASAPAKDTMRHFGFTPENIVAHARKQLSLNR